MRSTTPPLFAPPATGSQLIEPILLAPPDAARALAVSPRTLWGLTASGKIPCVRIGRAVRYSPDDVRAWVAATKSPKDHARRVDEALVDVS
ncbi:MAG TPA: helix-turn-helix domain-containing protein [Pirellulales bacterium]|nr:helix-turn-helix domain-containing protein [Pirellulales bacterium]